MIEFPEQTDKDLWQNLKHGDKHCFNELFKRYYSQLYYYGLKIVSDPDFVKENIQEVFIRIWETRQSLGNADNIKSYLLVSLRRRLLTAKLKIRPSVDIEKIEEYAFHFEVNEFEKHQEVSAEVREKLLTAINSLTKKQREIVMLFFYHELSYKEIAQVLEMGVQAARNLMYRTLIHLRESIGEKSLNALKNNFILLFSQFPSKKNGII